MLDNILNIYNDIMINFGLANFSANFTLKDIIQILIIVVILTYLYFKFIKNSQAEKLVRGILVFIIAAWIFSAVLIALEFQILGQIAQYVLS